MIQHQGFMDKDKIRIRCEPKKIIGSVYDDSNVRFVLDLLFHDNTVTVLHISKKSITH